MVLRERLVLAVGLLSALVLASAALVSFSDPEVAGRAALNKLGGDVAGAVFDEWEQMRRDPEVPAAEVLGFDYSWPAHAAPLRVREPVDLTAREPGGPVAFDALFAEAERAELDGDPGRALELALEALERESDRGRRAEARLRAIQLAASAARPDAPAVVLEQWRWAAAELAPEDARGDTSYELLCTLAALPLLEEAVRRGALEELDRAWFAGELALPGWAPELTAVEPWLFDVRPDPRRQALRGRLDQASQLGVESRERDLELLRGLALERALGELPEGLGDRRWRIRSLPGGHFVWRSDEPGEGRGTFVSAEGMVARLARRARERDLLPDGFHVEATPKSEGRMLMRMGLEGEDLRFFLHHEDPEAFVRAEGRRLGWIRAALLLMAVFSAAAGVSTFRALRRERRLAVLKTAFVAGVSHELRTPIASILLMAENLEAGRAPDAAAERRYHGLIRREAMRLRRLVDDVLDFSRLERGKGLDVKLEDTALAGWVADLREEITDWARRAGADVAFDTDGLEGSAALDREALRRAVFNLLDNARKHGAGAAIRFSARRADGELVLGVADLGPGIEPRRREEVFQPFARLHEGNGHVAGAGLGLAIVREIAEAHRGTARAVDGELGRGVVLEIRVPAQGAGGTKPEVTP